MPTESPAERAPLTPNGLPYTTELPDWPLPAPGVLPQGCACGGGGMVRAAAAGISVYAYGTIEADFPSLSVEKEFYQAIDLKSLPQEDKDAFSAGDTLDLWRINQIAQSSATLYQVLSRLDNRPIAREMCWSLRGLDGQRRWSIHPRDDKELGYLIAALQVGSDGNKQPQVLLGLARPPDGGLSPPGCGGNLPATSLAHLFGRSQDSIVDDLKQQAKCADLKPDNMSTLVSEILTLANNAGASAMQRAVNFVVLDDLDLYCLSYGLVYGTKPPNPNGFQLIDSLTLSAPSADGRELVEVVLVFQGADTTAIQRWARTVDVTGTFPFLAGEWTRFLGRG